MTAQGARNDFFVQVDESSLSNPQAVHLTKVRSRKTAKEVRIVRIKNISRLLNNGPIHLNMLHSKLFTVNHDKTEFRERSQYTWYGTIPEKQGDVIFVVTEEGITGSVWANMELYKVEPLGSGVHVVISVDQSQFLPEDPSLIEEGTSQKDDSTENESNSSTTVPPRSGKTLASVNVVIDVLVAYTQAVESLTNDIDGLIQLAIDETNQGYMNSGINITLNPVFNWQVDYVESGDIEIDLGLFEGIPDEYMPEIHSLRDQYYADVAILLTNDPTYCGRASILATESTAFAIVKYSCATGNYSFGHEIGHLQGALHDTRVEKSNLPYQYGHGYVYKPGDWRTIMAWDDPDCPGGSCVRKKYWSNPSVTYGVCRWVPQITNTTPEC